MMKETERTKLRYNRYGIPDIKEIYRRKPGIHLDFVVENFLLSLEIPPAKIISCEDTCFYFFREDTTRHRATMRKMLDYFIYILKHIMIGEIIVKIKKRKGSTCSYPDLDKKEFVKLLANSEKVKKLFQERDIATIVLVLFEKILSLERIFQKFVLYYHRKKSVPENFIGSIVEKIVDFMIDRYSRYSDKQILSDESILDSIIRRTARQFWHLFFDDIPSTAERLKKKNMPAYFNYVRKPRAIEYFELFFSTPEGNTEEIPEEGVTVREIWQQAC